MKKKTALVLSGGGFKGAYQLGALEFIQENWNEFVDSDYDHMKFDVVAGISTGSLTGLFVATEKFDQFKQFWAEVGKNGAKEIYTSLFLETSNPNKCDKLKMKFDKDELKKAFPLTLKLFLRVLFNKQAFFNELAKEMKNFNSIADNSPLREKVSKTAKVDDLKMPFICGYVSLDDGKYHAHLAEEFNSDKDFCNAIMASTSMPIVWKPVKEIALKDGTKHKNNVDGGIRCVSPLRDVIRQIVNDEEDCEYTIFIINCHSDDLENQNFDGRNIFEIANRSLTEITLAEIFQSDIKEFMDKNAIIEQINKAGVDVQIKDSKGKNLKYFNAVIIQPDHVLGNPLVACKANVDKFKSIGYEDAKEALSKHKDNEEALKTTIVNA